MYLQSVLFSCSTCGLRILSWSAKAAVTKYHSLSGLNNRHLFSHNSSLGKFKVQANVVSSESFLLGSQMAPVSWHPLTVERENAGVSSSTYKGTSPIGLGNHLYGLI